MKKLLLLFSIIIALSSCDDSVMIPKYNDSLTTVEILKNVDSALQVSILNEEAIYVLSNGVVVAKGDQNTTNDLFLAMLSFTIGFIVSVVIFSSLKEI